MVPAIISLESGSKFVETMEKVKFELFDNGIEELKTLIPRVSETLDKCETSNSDADPEIAVKRSADADALFIGISHQDCDWGSVADFAKHSFKMSLTCKFKGRTGMKLHGSFCFPDEEQGGGITVKVSMRSLAQQLVAQVQLGLFCCDLVVFGCEREGKQGFSEAVSEALNKSIEELLDNDGVVNDIEGNTINLENYNSLNHLMSTLRRKNESTWVISSPSDARHLLSAFQRRLSKEHHIKLISLGCKSFGCTKSLPDAERAIEAGIFTEILSESLHLDAVKNFSTYLMIDAGVEFSAKGRFLYWNPDACKLFCSSMGTGTIFHQFGVRQLTNFVTRSMIFERLHPLFFC